MGAMKKSSVDQNSAIRFDEGLAEAVRFELTEDFHPRQFSRLVHSTALPSFPFVAPTIIRKFMA